jgi:hypothetical protein
MTSQQTLTGNPRRFVDVDQLHRRMLSKMMRLNLAA